MLFDKGNFVCSLFNINANISDYKFLALNKLGRKWLWMNLKYYHSICLEEGKKNLK
jgi:hypothetical protein